MKTQKAEDVARTLLSKMGIQGVVSLREEADQIVLTIAEAEGRTDVAEILGGARGGGVSAFQFILNKIVNRFPEGRKHILVDAPTVPKREREERRPRRENKPVNGEAHAQAPAPRVPDEDVDPVLAELGRHLAEKARQLGKVITIHPMAAGDRRAIHVTVMSLEGVETISEGDGLYRRIHVVPAALRRGRGGERREGQGGERREGQNGEPGQPGEGGGRRRRRRGRRGGRGGDRDRGVENRNAEGLEGGEPASAPSNDAPAPAASTPEGSAPA